MISYKDITLQIFLTLAKSLITGQRGPAQLCTERTTAGPVRILVEPQTVPTAQQTDDHCRQSAGFYRSEMTAPSQGLNQWDAQQTGDVPAAWNGRHSQKLLRGPVVQAASPADHLLPPECLTRLAALRFLWSGICGTPTGSVEVGRLQPSTGAAD